jgi:hypothetical protein
MRAERSLLDGLRPILFPSRWEDPVQKVSFIDQRWMHVRGGHAKLEIGDEAAYLVVSVRDLDSAQFRHLAGRHADRERFAIDLIYGDVEGGQRIITRMGLTRSPAKDAAETEWAVSASRHWNLDRADPR